MVPGARVDWVASVRRAILKVARRCLKLADAPSELKTDDAD
jgi:hypothetical protein